MYSFHSITLRMSHRQGTRDLILSFCAESSKIDAHEGQRFINVVPHVLVTREVCHG